MRISFKRLKQLPVETASGFRLGRVLDCILEVDGQLVAQYVVRAHLFAEDRLIGRDQVLSMTSERMVVEDRLLKPSIDERIAEASPSMSSKPAVVRESNS